IGLVRQPSYEVPKGSYWSDCRIAGSIQLIPLLRMERLQSGHRAPTAFSDNLMPVDASVRMRLEKMMLDGPTQAEREAAARTLVAWPPDGYKLRFAEWGVWIHDGSDLVMVKSVMDEIPAFVHQTANPVGEFRARINELIIIDKPVIHLTADRPMAVDIQVMI